MKTEHEHVFLPMREKGWVTCACGYTKKTNSDTTQKRRQSRRREKLNEIAKASGFASWSAYETACLNGVAKPNKA